MGSIKGDVNVMPLTDLLQWVELCKKTGTLRIYNQGAEKKIFLEKGAIIFVSSSKPGERLGEYLHKGSLLELEKIKSALLQSQTMKVLFTQRLVDLKYFTEEELREIISRHAREILFDAIGWTEGTFEFIQDEVPSYVLRGTISLSTTELIHSIFMEIERTRLGFRGKGV